MSAMGWILYLFTNVSGRRYPKGSLPVNHFLPSSPVFKREEAPLVITSNIALAGVLFLFYRIVDAFGWNFFFMSYVTVYFVTNYWLVTITFLQHTHPALPHFSTARWNYVQGAMATVDRDYGWFWNMAMHNIQDTHVAHHLFSYLPHYHAQEATEAIKKVIGPYYVKSTAERRWFGVLRELWSAIKFLNFVAEDNHPALSVFEAATEAERKGEDAVGAVASIRDEALLKAPHVNGRDVSKEVYWFRTVQQE
jgi:omega-6 fatty acid desaturase (delta-12 desaturase)